MPSIKNLLVLALAASVTAQVSQKSDGQPTVGTVKASPVSQITDGQIQAPTSKAPTSVIAPVSQISDGQIQAPTTKTTVAPVSQISDGQIQAPTTTVGKASQISDGQIQAPTGGASGVPKPSNNGTFAPGQAPTPFTGGAALVTASGAVLGLAAFVYML
ncbi:MAG: hypothetical protein LQ350_004894 [Teloschistes chrysophthalmus]|nr:MAG: hypothetical protein LQ350_004894 [Niorma chrysophthalma]